MQAPASWQRGEREAWRMRSGQHGASCPGYRQPCLPALPASPACRPCLPAPPAPAPPARAHLVGGCGPRQQAVQEAVQLGDLAAQDLHLALAVRQLLLHVPAPARGGGGSTGRSGSRARAPAWPPRACAHGGRQQAAGSRQQAAGSRQQAAGSSRLPLHLGALQGYLSYLGLCGPAGRGGRLAEDDNWLCAAVQQIANHALQLRQERQQHTSKRRGSPRRALCRVPGQRQ
jgi:hypothetical protein